MIYNFFELSREFCEKGNLLALTQNYSPFITCIVVESVGWQKTAKNGLHCVTIWKATRRTAAQHNSFAVGVRIWLELFLKKSRWLLLLLLLPGICAADLIVCIKSRATLTIKGMNVLISLRIQQVRFLRWRWPASENIKLLLVNVKRISHQHFICSRSADRSRFFIHGATRRRQKKITLIEIRKKKLQSASVSLSLSVALSTRPLLPCNLCKSLFVTLAGAFFPGRAASSLSHSFLRVNFLTAIGVSSRVFYAMTKYHAPLRTAVCFIFLS